MHKPAFQARGVGDLLDAAFRLYRTHFKTFVTISGVLLVPFAVLELLALASPSLIRLIANIQNLFIIGVLAGTLTVASSAAYRSQSLLVGNTYRAGRRKWLVVVGTAIRQSLIIVLPIFIIAVIFYILVPTNLSSNRFIGLAAIIALAIPFIIFFTTRYAVAIPAVVLEHVNASQSLKRSRELTQGMFWHVFWCVFATSVLVLLISQLPASIIGLLTPYLVGYATMIQAVAIILIQLGLIIALPFQYLVYTLLYYDLRIRKEGYDLELRAQADMPSAPAIVSEL